MDANRGYPPPNRAQRYRPTSITPAPDTSAADVLTVGARLRAARASRDALNPNMAAEIASQLLEQGHYRAAATAAELAAQLAEIALPTAAAAAAADMFGPPIIDAGPPDSDR